MCSATPCSLRRSPASSSPSCRDSSRSMSDGWHHSCRGRRRPFPASAVSADCRHQRHPYGRRDAGAAGDLHDHSAPPAGWRSGGPAQDQRPAGWRKDEPLVVSVNAKDEVFLGETKYEIADLGTKLKAVHEEKPDQRVFIRGDRTI